MLNRQFKVIYLVTVFLVPGMFICSAKAEEKVIQQEKISFAKCLNVITTSENKLSIAPQITDLSSKKRLALFKLTDGTLTITCDGEKGIVTVSTNTD